MIDLSYYFLDFNYDQKVKVAHKIQMKKGSALITGCGISVSSDSMAGRLLSNIPDGIEKCSCCDAVEISELFSLVYIPENTFISFQGFAGLEDVIRLLRVNCNSPNAIKFLADILEK